MDFLEIIGKAAGPVGQMVEPLTYVGTIYFAFHWTRPGHIPSPEGLKEESSVFSMYLHSNYVTVAQRMHDQ